MLTLFTIAIMILFTKCLLWGTIRAAARDWVLGQITNIHTIQIQATRPPPSRRRRRVMERGVWRLEKNFVPQSTSSSMHHWLYACLKGHFISSIMKSHCCQEMSTLVWARVRVSAPPPSSLSSGTGWASPPSTSALATPRSWTASRPVMQVANTAR